MREKGKISQQKLDMGVCYYPEHWDRSLWKSDLERMLDSGIHTVRIAEFAWNLFEPAEEVFTFDFFDDFLDLCEQKGMKVIFCTPTATPPAWLTAKYPETLNVGWDGHLFTHGVRRHYNYNAEIYRNKVSRLCHELGSHYGKRECIVGWQLDNEINNTVAEFYSEADQSCFREWLKERYKTLDALNHTWGTVFWNQTYTSWEEVHLPGYNPRKASNPHHKLDSIRFFDWSALRFMKLQSDILRQYIPETCFITTNGLFPHLDYDRAVGDSLDFLMYDSYPNGFHSSQRFPVEKFPLKDRSWSFNLSRMRAISPCFGVMEQQSGPGGWSCFPPQPVPQKGQIRLWTFQSIAHGADYISYFRWRTCTFGTEIYWHGILNYDNQPNSRLMEVRKTRNDMEKCEDVAGAKYLARVAIARDYQNEWDGENDLWHGPLREKSNMGIFIAAQQMHIPIDFVNVFEEKQTLQHYDILFYPHPTIITEPVCRKLETYVRDGGTLILGARSGCKDINGHFFMQTLPGLFSRLAGLQLEDFSALPEDAPVAHTSKMELEADGWAEALLPFKETRVLDTYNQGVFAGKPALTEHSFGQGKVLYFGSCFSAVTASGILRYLKANEPWAEWLELQKTCELAIREKEGIRYWFILNYTPDSQAVVVHKPMQDVLSGKEIEGALSLEAYGVLILKTQDP